MKTLVLLSGGLDSTAALLWARANGGVDAALWTYYGQPAATREGERAVAVAKRFELPFLRLDIASAYFGGAPRGLFLPKPAGVEGGVDRAFVPLRNPLLLSAAAARALRTWPDGGVRLVVGFNADDAAGFPDCRQAFLVAFAQALNAGLPEPQVVFAVPWLDVPKAGVVRWVLENAPTEMPLIEASWSCYREQGPCGECTACVTRAKAFSET
jgi:7-cyano-7-deazaguanine synthase